MLWLIWLAPRWTYIKGSKYVSSKEGEDIVSFLLCAHGNEVMVFIKNNLINFFILLAKIFWKDAQDQKVREGNIKWR